MAIIFQVIGTPQEEDLGFLESNEAQDYVKSFPKMERVQLSDVYPAAEEEGIELLQKML